MKKKAQKMGDILNPLSMPQPGDASTKLYANED